MSVVRVAVPPSATSRGRASRLRVVGDTRLRAGISRLDPGEVAWTATEVPGWGRLFLAATRHGACQVELLPRRGPLQEPLARLESGSPNLMARRGDAPLRPLVEHVLAWLANPRHAALDLPLDAPGTDFQQQVWQLLRRIPVGRTLPYGVLAEALGRPTATRAVGQAIGANRVAFAIPCHRAVGAGGDLGGFRWGAPIKRRLLALEQGESA